MTTQLIVLIGIYACAALPLSLGAVSLVVDWIRRGIRFTFVRPARVSQPVALKPLPART